MEKFSKQLKDTWYIVLFIVSMVIWYANTNSRLTAVEAKTIEQSSLISELSSLKTDVAVIKANVEFIKQQVK